MTTDYLKPSAWTGWVIFAAAVMFTIGAVDIIQGLAALLKDETYLITESGLLVTTDFTAWGWTLIAWGIVLILTAAALFSGKEWARWFAIVAVIINGIGQIAWFPAYPLWSLIALSLFAGLAFGLSRPATSESDASRKLHALFDREWEWTMEQSPTWASQLGDRRWNTLWPAPLPLLITIL